MPQLIATALNVVGDKGRLQSSSSSYSFAAGGTALALSSTGGFCGQWYQLGTYQVSETFQKWDISSIPSDSIINSASIRISIGIDNSFVDFDLEVSEFNFATLVADASDWQTPSELAALLSGSKRLATRNTSGMAIDTYYTMTNTSTNLVDRLQAAVDVSATRFQTVCASNQTRLSSNPGGGDGEYVQVSTPATTEAMELTVNYSAAGGLQQITLGAFA